MSARPAVPAPWWRAATTPPPAVPTPQQQIAVSVETAAEFVVGKLTAKQEPGPWEVLLEPLDGGRLPTSDALEDAIRRRALGLIPPTVVRGLAAGVKGFRLEGVLLVVEGAL